MLRAAIDTLKAKVALLAVLAASVAVVALLACGGALATAATGPAAPASGGSAPLAVETEFDETDESEEEEESEDECEEAEEEFEAGETDKAAVDKACRESAGKGRGGQAPEECVLRSMHVRAAANKKLNAVKLTIGYTTYEPTNATVELRKGSARIASIPRHLGRSGVLRIVKAVRKPAPTRITVRVRIRSAPASCAKYQTKTVAVSTPAR